MHTNFMERKKVIRYGNSIRSILGKRKFSLSKFLSGFTLIELLVVVAIIGVLAASLIFILNPGTQFAKARDAQRKSDLKQIQNALETYYNDNGYYPNTLSFGAAFGTYMSKVPNDPQSPSKTYVYSVGLGGQAYYLYASLERNTDPQACNGGAACTTAPPGTPCGAGATCSYGVSSSNVIVSAQTPTPTPTSAPTPTSPPLPTPTPTSAPNPTPPLPTPTPTSIPTPTPALMTIDFNDTSGGNQPLNGQYPTGVINWGSGSWISSDLYGNFSTNNITFSGVSIPNAASFSFITPKTLIRLKVYNGDVSTASITITCPGNTNVVRNPGPGIITNINTNWTTNCSPVTISSNVGWKTHFDNLEIQ